ncbi:hypothetical protein [Flavobacterium johnsoniae]|uniref:Uncharacterized protein n=1 Tax=Flavobacterium johnsoniae TaxID=986 RepID=A0A1M5UM26_FLAJO|nr:hypothetical protein [Flavobacterium johnsoniae]SHH63980.1 hypothetical protein SAMN05444388_11448 [Flavobacterium johnsoniae]
MKSKTAYIDSISHINIILKILFICLLTALPVSTLAQETSPIPLQRIFAPIVERDTSGERYFGDLLIKYTIDPTGKVVVCTLYLSTVLVGIESLTATNPLYQFELQSGASTTSGCLSIYLNFAPSISTLKADLTYSVKENNTNFPYKGDLVGWYIYD